MNKAGWNDLCRLGDDDAMAPQGRAQAGRAFLASLPPWSGDGGLWDGDVMCMGGLNDEDHGGDSDG